MKKRNIMKKFAALMMAAIMIMAMGITSMADETTTVYPRFCKDGKGYDTISMAQKAVASEATVTATSDGYDVTFKVQSFTAEKGGFSGTGSVGYITIDGEEYYPDTTTQEITIPISKANYEVNSKTKYTDVSIKVNIALISGTISVPLTQEADLYFSSTPATYTE